MRRPSGTNGGATYVPTAAGRDLAGIIRDVAIWGRYWARDMTIDDLDPGVLAWGMHTRLDAEKMPAGRTVLEFDFSGAPEGVHRFWLLSENGKVDMCLKHPGYETDLLVEGDLRTFVECWRGLRDLRSEIDRRTIKLTGPRELKRAFPDWLMFSLQATYDRKRPGKEQTLYRRKTDLIET